jgi:hypothetical protein
MPDTIEKKIFQIQVYLKDINPKIWRRLLIPSDLSFADLHKLIQASMGWSGKHLHKFIYRKQVYAPALDVRFEPDAKDYHNYDVGVAFKRANSKIQYLYDFADNWMHEIVVEKTLPWRDDFNRPVCLSGKMKCPPENCGGVWGYSKLKNESMNSLHHEDDASDLDLLAFSPNYFNLDKTNESIASIF